MAPRFGQEISHVNKLFYNGSGFDPCCGNLFQVQKLRQKAVHARDRF